MSIDEYNEETETNESEIEDQESTPDCFHVITYPADFTLEGLVNKYKRGTLQVPGFQRKYVWTIKQASRLIESFLLGLPVPSIFLFTEPKDQNKQLVIDGQQRLMTLVYFFEGYFGEPVNGKRKVFKLTGLNEKSPYYNKSYNDLKETNESAFNSVNDAVLRAFVVKQLQPEGNTSIYHIFERLNTGGTQLVGQEIRNCVYHGNFNDLINDLNKNPMWRQIFGTQEPHKRQKDAELILRFFALHYGLEKYKRPMKDFMSNFMADHQNLPEEKLDELTHLFTSTTKIILETLGEKPFHIWSGLNVSAFDSVYTAISRNLGNNYSRLKENFESLKKDQEFIKGVRGPTADESIVELRMRLAFDYLVG